MVINECYTLLCENGMRGIQFFPDITEIFVLMFADDIALIADTVIGLQRQLNLLSKFCNSSKLRVNISKTKILVFKRGGQLSNREHWSYSGQDIEIVNGFSYVGLLFTCRLSLYRMAEETSSKAKKALIHVMHCLRRYKCLPYKTFFKFFDSKIMPIILYGSEIWGLMRPKCIELLHVYACKRFLCVNQNTCNDAILGDVGRYPMYIYAFIRCVKYWIRILGMPGHRYVKLCYERMRHYDNIGYKIGLLK